MEKFPKHYSLLGEDEKSFHVHDKRDNTRFHISKKDVHPANQLHILRMEKYSHGGGPPVDDYDTGLSSKPPEERVDSGPSFFDNYIGGTDYGSPPVQQDQQMPEGAQHIPISQWTPPANVDTTPQLEAQPPGIFNQMPDMQGGVPQVPPTPVLGMQGQAEMSQGQSPTALSSSPDVYPTAAGFQHDQNAMGRSIMAEAHAKTDQNQQNSRALEAWFNNDAARSASYDRQRQDLVAQQDRLTQGIANAEVDPNHVWNSKSTGSKIGTILGIFLAGVGSGLRGSTHNSVIDMLENEVNRDIEAQKVNLGKKQSLLSDNLRIQGNLQSAEAATRLQASSVLQGQLQKIAAQTGNPIIMEQAKQMALKWKMDSTPMLTQVANNEMTMKIKKVLQSSDVSKLNPEQFVPHVVPADQQKKVLEEIGVARNAVQLEPELIKAFKDAATEQTVLRRVGGLRGDSPGVMRMKALMLPLFDAIDDTVRAKAMEEAYHDHVPGMGDMGGTTESRLNGFVHWLHAKQSAPTALASGIDLNRFDATRRSGGMAVSPQDKQFVDWASRPENRNNPKAQMVLKKNGVNGR